MPHENTKRYVKTLRAGDIAWIRRQVGEHHVSESVEEVGSAILDRITASNVLSPEAEDAFWTIVSQEHNDNAMLYTEVMYGGFR